MAAAKKEAAQMDANDGWKGLAPQRRSRLSGFLSRLIRKSIRR